MVAVAHVSPVDLRRLVVVRTAPVVRPARTTPPPTVYRRRRTLVLLILVIIGAALVLSLQGVFAALAHEPVNAGEGTAAPAATVYVVQPGDTFWELARRLRPNDDPRPLVARMVAAHGSPVLVTGERLPLPAAA